MVKKYSKVLALLVAVVAAVGMLFLSLRSQSEPERLYGMADAKEVNVNPKVAGRIVKICVSEGEEVKAGQVLAYLDRDTQRIELGGAQAAVLAQLAQLEQTNLTAANARSVLAASVDKAESDYATASADDARYQKLLAAGAISEQTYEGYHSKLVAAESALKTARANLLQNSANDKLLAARAQEIEQLKAKLASVELAEDEAVIRAPFDGIVTKKYLEEGALVSSAVPLFAIQNPTDNWVNFKVKETEIDKYAVGDAVALTGRNENIHLTGEVVAISRRPDYATVKATSERGDKDIVAFNVKVQVNSTQVYPGMRFYIE